MSSGRFYHESLYRFGQAQPSYWEATAPRPNLKNRPLAGAQSCDVAIIGGGYTGLSAALHLARDFGIDVRVLEAGHIGWGASGRNGGFCSIGGTHMSIKRQVARFGAEETRRYYQSQIEAIELVRELGRDEGIAFETLGEGEYSVADSPADFRGLEHDASVYRDLLGIDAHIVSQQAFREIGYDSPHQHGALILKPAFGLHPLRFVQGLGEAAERRGAVLHPNSEVLAWTKSDGMHRLHTGSGTLSARRVIIACNGFMPENLHANLAGRTLPLQSVIVVTRPLSEAELADHAWRTEDLASNSAHVFHYYRMLPDKRLLIGGRSDCVGDPTGAERTARDLQRTIARMWPNWAHVDIDYCWRGLVCFSSTLRPAIGRFSDDPSVSFGFAYHGNGVNTATWAGRHLAHWLAGGNSGAGATPDHLPALVRGMPPRFPLPALRRTYARAGIAYHQFLDRF